MVICLEWDADLNMVQLMPLPLTVSCFSKIQIGFTFLVPAHQDSIRQRAIKWVCVYSVLGRKERVILWACLCVCLSVCLPDWLPAWPETYLFILFIYWFTYANNSTKARYGTNKDTIFVICPEPMAVAWSSIGGVAMRYMLSVLWMDVCI